MPKRATLHDTQEEAAYDNKPIGAGPMKLIKHVKASMMKFERFDDFYYQHKNGFPEDKRVNFQSLDLFLVPEEATRVAALRAGQADMVPASLAFRKQIEAAGGRMVFGQEGVVVEPRLIGCWKPQYPCRDKRVRLALNYAIDKEVIRDRLYGGPEVFQVKGWGPVTPSTFGYTPGLDSWPYDPTKARQLLAEAGYPGGKGFGKLIVNTWVSTAMPFLPESAQLAADFWKRELGLDVEVKVGDRVETEKRQQAGELNGQILWGDQETRIDASSGIATLYGDPKSTTRLHEEPELFRLVQETVQILDPGKRAEASKKLYLRLRDESYQLGVGYVNIPWAVGPRVVTWRPYPQALYPSALHTINVTGCTSVSGATSTCFNPTTLGLASIGASGTVTVETVGLPAGADGVQLNIQHSKVVTITSPACVGIFSGAAALVPTPVSGGTLIGCILLSGNVSGNTGNVMTFVLTRVGAGTPLLTFGLGGGFSSQFSDGGNPISVGATNTLQVTTAATVNGTVTLQGRTETFPAGVGHGIATVTLSPGGVTVSVNADGSFQILGVADGTFTLTASAPGYVSRQRSNVVVAGSPVSVSSVQLRCGLVNNDNFVNIHDISATVAGFGTSPSARVDAQGRFVDQNGDGFVNINDITCVVSGFGTTSPLPWP